MKELGASLGAVVIVKVDHHAVSHVIVIGNVGIIFQVKVKEGGEVHRVATEVGILCYGTHKSDWRMPLDQYSLRFKANDFANIPDKLEMIVRRSIKLGTFAKQGARLTTIQAAHQVAIGATSPCKKGHCNCKERNVETGVNA